MRRDWIGGQAEGGGVIARLEVYITGSSVGEGEAEEGSEGVESSKEEKRFWRVGLGRGRRR